MNPTGIYANLNRSSLMSTGSSEESSGSSEVMSPPALSSTSEAVFSWPNYSVCNESPSPSPSSNVTDQEHRSVSQIGEPPGSFIHSIIHLIYSFNYSSNCSFIHSFVHLYFQIHQKPQRPAHPILPMSK